jgi:hypothetical protein
MKKNLMLYILLSICQGCTYKVVFNANDDVALFLQIVEHERTKLIHILQDVLYTNAR